jgi:hypothetical protein
MYRGIMTVLLPLTVTLIRSFLFHIYTMHYSRSHLLDHSYFPSSSSESLRTMILPSSGGPRMSRLRSPKSFLASSSSREVSATESSSPEDEARSTTRTGSEGPPCSHRGKQRQRDEVAGGECVGRGDPERDGGGVEALLGEEDPSSEGERGRLRFFLSSIHRKRRVRKTLSAGYRCARWMATQDDEDIYSLRSVVEQQ